MKSCGAFAIVAAIVIASAGAAEPMATRMPEFVRPFPIVAIRPGASDVQNAAAKEIADAVGVRSVSPMEKNPVCCIWLEVTGWTPSPGEAGYFIINQGGGSIISASDEEQLKRAVKQFKKTVRMGKNGPEVPVGMMTSYRIAAAPAAER
jgi:hypothetical protein